MELLHDSPQASMFVQSPIFTTGRPPAEQLEQVSKLRTTDASQCSGAQMPGFTFPSRHVDAVHRKPGLATFRHDPPEGRPKEQSPASAAFGRVSEASHGDGHTPGYKLLL
jgi:hypothetical protein